MTGAGTGCADLAAAIEALRARGAPNLDPVRFCHIEALARRAVGQGSETRRLLDDRLAQLVAACGERLDRASSPIAAAAPAPTPPPAGALAALLAHIAHQAAEPSGGASAATGGPAAQARPELKAIRDFRCTWSRLSVDQRMTQSLAKVPGNAGPLNTERLLHQALTLMRDVSPDYLHRFMSHVEALLWMEQAGLPAAAATKDPTRMSRDRRHASARPEAIRPAPTDPTRSA